MNSIKKFINYFFLKLQNKWEKKDIEQRENYVGKRKIDHFRRNIIKYKNLSDLISVSTQFLKDFLQTENVGFYFWNEEIGHFVDSKEKEYNNSKIQIFDPFILTISEYDIIFLKRNIDFIRNENHKNIILNFMNTKNANILIPLILNESILGFIYANTSKYITISEYFILEEFRYFVIITLSNTLIYSRLENILKNLEKTIQERTKELEKAQQILIQQEKMATLGTMIAGIAHEFNTPISVIQNSSTQVIQYFESLVEIFFLKKDFRKLPDEFLNVLYYFIYHLAVSHKDVQIKTYKLKKMLKEYLNSHHISYDEKLIQFLVDFNFYKGDNIIFENKNNLIHKIIELYNQSNEEDRQLILDIMKFLAIIYENINRIQYSSQSIIKLVRSLRNYVRSSKNELLSHNIVQIIENSIQLVMNSIKHKIKIITNYEYNKEIVCDSNQIQQVIINIVMNAFNALKSTDNPDPTIKILTREISNEKIEIQIQDNGPGIPEEIQLQVWDPFFTTKPQGEGTGLGLGIVKNIIENHQGKVFFESNQQGTTFFIQLYKNPP